MSDITPNVVISNPDTRRKLGNTLYVISVIVGVGTLFFGIFPELAGSVDVGRIITFVTGAVSILSGAFGLSVTRPNIPQS